MHIKMGRPLFRVTLTITSSDDDQFSNPRTFNSIPESFEARVNEKEIRRNL